MENKMTFKQVIEGTTEEVLKSVNPQLEAITAKISDLSETTNILAHNTAEKTDNGINQTRLLKASMEVVAERANGIVHEGGQNQAIFAKIKSLYGKTDPAFVAVVEEKVKDLTATGNGGELIVQEYADGFLAQLWDKTVLAPLGVTFMPTSTGNLTIRKIVEGVSAGYIGELGTIDTSTIKFGHISLSVKKLMALVPVSRDLLRYSSMNVDAIVRDQIINELAQVASKGFLYGKGNNYEPQGVFVGKDTTLKMSADVEPKFDTGLDMIAMLGKANQDTSDLAWVMGWDTYVALQKEVQTSVGRAQFNELAGFKWHGKDVIVTNHIKQEANKEDLLLIKKSDILAIQGLNVQIMQSAEASIATADGYVNAFTNDFIITRAIVEHDFRLARKESAVVAKVKLK